MSDKVEVSGTIKLDDQSSATVRAIQKNIAAIGDSARQVGQQFKRFANMGALGGVAQNARNAASQMATLGRSIVRIGGAISGVIGVAGFGTLAYEMQEYVGATDMLGQTSARLGMTAEDLQKLRHAAKLSGVDIYMMDQSLEQLTRRMGDAATGKNKELAGLMKKLGISLRDAQGNIRGAADVMPLLANAFKNNENAATRAQMANALFGKSGQDMIQMLADGGPALRGMMDELVKLGIITNDQVARAMALNDAQDRMNTAIRGVANSIMGALVPALTPLVEQFTEWVAANREWIATNITKFIEDFAGAVASIPWGPLLSGLKEFGGFLAAAWTWLRSIHAVVPLVGAIFGGILLKAILGVTSAITGLGVALVTNPIGAAIAAIAVAVYLIYRNWDTLVAFFENLWPNVKKAFDAALVWLQQFWADFSGGFLKDAWNPLVAWFGNLWQQVKETFNGAVGWLDTFITQFIPGLLVSAWEGVAAGFSALWQLIKAPFDAASGWLDSFRAAFTPGNLLTVWQAVADAFDTIWNGPRLAFDAALAWLGDFISGFVPAGLLGVWEALSGGYVGVWQAVRGPFEEALTWLATFIARFIPQPLIDAWNAVSGFFNELWYDIESVFKSAWAVISPIIDSMMAAIRPLMSAVEGVGNVVGNIAGGVSNVAGKVAGGVSGATSWVGRQLGIGGDDAAPVNPVQSAPVNPVQDAQRAAPVARVDGEVKSTIKIELPPGMTATATTEDRGRVNSSVDVGTSMVPA